MRYLPLLIVAAACRGGVATTPFEPYRAQSPFLLDPSRNLDLVVDTMSFITKGRDDVNGGFYIYLGDDGAPVFPDDPWWGTTLCDETFDYHLKTVFGQARVAYGFSRAFMVTGDVSYLEQADHALDFMYAHGQDPDDGGWYFSTDEVGDVAPWTPCKDWDPNEFKWSFTQFYPLVGVSAMTEATLGASPGGRASENWLRLEAGLELIDEKLWDDRPEYQGYYDEADLDWEDPRGKGFTGAADAITTHAAAVYLQTGDAAHRTRMLDLADGISEWMAPTITLPQTAFGFVERFDADWRTDSSDTSGFVGHLLKAVWCVSRAYVVEPRPEYLEAAQLIVDEVWDNGGYDHEYGGVFQEFDWKTGEVVEGKNHWNLEQGLTGGLTGYHVTADEQVRSRMLQVADESLDFFMTKFLDPADGVAYTATDNAGEPTDLRKGHVWKAGYHDTEFGFLAYVYGSLYYTHEPIVLHYYAENDGTDHSMVLSPVEDPGLEIVAVELDGEPYPDFDPATRRLEVPSGVGGVFAVTFALPE